MPVCSRNTISTLASQDRTRLPSLQFRNAPQAVLRGDALNLGTQPHSIFDGWLTRELWAGAISVHTARTPHWEWQAPVLTPWYDTIIYASDVFSNTILHFFTFDTWSNRLPRSTWYFIFLFGSSHHDIWNLLTIYGSCDRDGWNWDTDNFLFTFLFSLPCFVDSQKGSTSWRGECPGALEGRFFLFCCMILTLLTALLYFILFYFMHPRFSSCTCAPALIAFLLKQRVFYIFLLRSS